MTTQHKIEQAIMGHLNSALFSIERPTPHMRGKVRDMFDDGQTIYMINTDRVSAFDQVLGTIPLKGALLCEQAEYWFNFSKHICPNHLLDRPDPQIMVCKKANTFPVEVIVRGFLAGSLMREDKFTRGSAYGLSLDPNLTSYAQFEEPIITPTTKAKSGEHDEPISAKDIVAHHLVDQTRWQEIESYALALFTECAQKARRNGLLLVDTKYEFGLIDGQVHLIDEVHTSDSSRFFIESDYREKVPKGQAPTMLDKEYLRQHLLAIGIDPKHSSLAGMQLGDELRIEVAKRYFSLTEKITGQTFLPPSMGAQLRVHAKVAELIC